MFTNDCEDTRKGESSLIVTGIANWYSHYGNHFKEFSWKLKVDLPYDLVIPLLDICPKDLSSYSSYTCSSLIIAALSKIAMKRKQLKCPSADEWVTKVWHVTYAL